MNIFYLDKDPVAAARAHADRHVLKMVIETAQLLSTAWLTLHSEDQLPEGDKRALPQVFVSRTRPAHRPSAPPPPIEADGPLRSTDGPLWGEGVWLLNGQRIYRATHAHHPCARWARAAGGHYRWLWRLGIALAEEYTYRWGPRHATLSVLRTLEPLPPALVASADAFEPPPLAMPAEYHDSDAVAAYRAYYVGAKHELLIYTRRDPPDWINTEPETVAETAWAGSLHNGHAVLDPAQ